MHQLKPASQPFCWQVLRSDPDAHIVPEAVDVLRHGAGKRGPYVLLQPASISGCRGTGQQSSLRLQGFLVNLAGHTLVDLRVEMFQPRAALRGADNLPDCLSQTDQKFHCQVVGSHIFGRDGDLE